LIMAAYTRAFIGSILLKFIDNPIRVDIVITNSLSQNSIEI